jgi:phosphopantetheinyl transferase (holo-ACP synthase)
MPLFYQQNINDSTRLAIWDLQEEEAFFGGFTEIVHPQKRLQHLGGRYLLGYLFPSFDKAAIAIAASKKPFLPDGSHQFSISHCTQYAAALVSTSSRVGIDIEAITERVHRIRHKFLHATEHEMLEKNASELLRLTAQLTIIWSAKEAIFKWWGIGNIDFSEQMILDQMPVAQDGILPAKFIEKNGTEHPLVLHYKVLDAICLVWVCSK